MRKQLKSLNVVTYVASLSMYFDEVPSERHTAQSLQA